MSESRHRASSMLRMYGLNYCADHTNGKIYEYSLDIFNDDGEPIIKERDMATLHGGMFEVPGKRLFFDKVEFVIVAGAGEVEGTGLGPQIPFASVINTVYILNGTDSVINGTDTVILSNANVINSTDNVITLTG
jgi:hypothetical protein